MIRRSRECEPRCFKASCQEHNRCVVERLRYFFSGWELAGYVRGQKRRVGCSAAIFEALELDVNFLVSVSELRRLSDIFHVPVATEVTLGLCLAPSICCRLQFLTSEQKLKDRVSLSTATTVGTSLGKLVGSFRSYLHF